MKGYMHGHVESQKSTMFNHAVEQVQRLLTQVLAEVKEELLAKVDRIFIGVERDYSAVVIGQEQGAQKTSLPREQRAMRKSVLGIVDNAELVFKRAVGLEPDVDSPEPEPSVGDEVKPEIDVDGEGIVDGQEQASEDIKPGASWLNDLPAVFAGDESEGDKKQSAPVADQDMLTVKPEAEVLDDQDTTTDSKQPLKDETCDDGIEGPFDEEADESGEGAMTS
jgi:hypothetical protein